MKLQLLDAFAKLREATISIVMSVCPYVSSFWQSVRIEKLDSQWMIFHEIWYLNIFRKSVLKLILTRIHLHYVKTCVHL
jgi:hypothetical protein